VREILRASAGKAAEEHTLVESMASLWRYWITGSQDDLTFARRAIDHALATLRQLGPDGSAAVTYLRDALKYTKDDDMAGEIAKTLGAMGSAAAPAVPELTAALGRTTMWPRYAAIEALGRLGPAAAPALPTLQKMTRDRDQDVAAAAHEAVRRLQRSAKTK